MPPLCEGQLTSRVEVAPVELCEVSLAVFWRGSSATWNPGRPLVLGRETTRAESLNESKLRTLLKSHDSYGRIVSQTT